MIAELLHLDLDLGGNGNAKRFVRRDTTGLATCRLDRRLAGWNDWNFLRLGRRHASFDMPVVYPRHLWHRSICERPHRMTTAACPVKGKRLSNVIRDDHEAARLDAGPLR